MIEYEFFPNGLKKSPYDHQFLIEAEEDRISVCNKRITLSDNGMYSCTRKAGHKGVCAAEAGGWTVAIWIETETNKT